MNEYEITVEDRMIDDKTVVVYTVVDCDGYPINHGHFTDRSEAEYVRDQMATGNYVGDHVSNLSQGMGSWIDC